jgi:hypothetical protein
VRRIGTVERVENLWVRTAYILHYRRLISFFLLFSEMSPHKVAVGLFYFYGKVRRRGKVHNWSNDTFWTFIYAHAPPHSALSQSTPKLHTSPHGNCHSLYFRKAEFPPFPPLTTMFRSMITKVKLAFTYLYVWNLAAYEVECWNRERKRSHTPWDWFQPHSVSFH